MDEAKPHDPKPADAATEALFQRVVPILSEQLDIPAERFTLDSTFEELGIDSLDGLNVVFAVEEAFDIEIPDDSARDLVGVRDLLSKLQPLVSEAA